MALIEAIFIDVEKQTVTKVKIKKGIQAIYNMLECTCFSCPIQYDNMDTLYCDDEGLYKPEIKGAFYFPDWAYPIVGNALIIGGDDEGDSVSVKSNVDDFSKIRFLHKDSHNLKKYVDQFR